MAKRKKYDWEAIEKEYRAGVLSIREIASKHGCSHTAINAKAKKLSWDRDLTEKVNQKVKLQLVSSDKVSTKVSTSCKETEKEIVEHAAATQVEVVRSHRKYIKNATQVVNSLLDTLSEVAKDVDKEKIQQHSSASVNLVNALKTLTGMERQAFNIQDNSAGSSDKDVCSEIYAMVQGNSRGLPGDD